MKDKTSIEIEKSSGNVFEDLQLPNPEEQLFKAELAYSINNLIKKRGLKQKDAANLLGIDQPKISALSKGRVSGFSVERLFRFLYILNQDIEIIIRPHINKNNHHNMSHVQVRDLAA